MKRIVALVLSIALAASMLVSCSNKNDTPQTKSTTISVVTSYGSEDGNRDKFLSLISEFENETGYKVVDKSGTSNEEWKNKINAEFQTGAEPDVLMFYTGSDSNEIVRSQKLVSLDEIKEEFPEYGSNMNSSAVPMSLVDGKQYALPVNGYWEGLFVNKQVLKACGIEAMPTSATTWEQFMDICEKVKNAGFIPISVSLQEVPHYLFEYTVFNEGTPSTHAKIPTSSKDAIGKNWIKGISTIKEMYEKGYFPYNTLVASDTETFQLFATNKAAFVIDGSWKMGWFSNRIDEIGELTDGIENSLDNFYVTYFPSKGKRINSDIISGISMGYFITRRAWDDPKKRKACVDFINKMTSDDVINEFSNGAESPTPLKSAATTSSKHNSSLHVSAMMIYKNATTYTPSVLDGLNITARNWLLGSMTNIVKGQISIDEAVEIALSMPQKDTQ